MNDYAYGIHSNIPPCCVRAFVAYYEVYRKTYYSVYRWKQFGLDPKTDLIGIGYVPCAPCMADIIKGILKPAVIHKCDLSCETFLSGE